MYSQLESRIASDLCVRCLAFFQNVNHAPYAHHHSMSLPRSSSRSWTIPSTSNTCIFSLYTIALLQVTVVRNNDYDYSTMRSSNKEWNDDKQPHMFLETIIHKTYKTVKLLLFLIENTHISNHFLKLDFISALFLLLNQIACSKY